ncbi:MAG: SET domain-containing protein [Deltaproteobacteria bacterium]|nr:SET domain-containing protein [Deltaproteobacteria bacterium]
MPPPVPERALRQPRYLSVRRSPLAGLGVFTTRAIPKGTRLLEYLGERISHDEAGERYYAAKEPDAFVLLFTVNRKVVIDGGVGGRAARYVNHSCDPNCEADEIDGRIFITSIREIPAGAELTYDYNLEAPSPLPRDWRRRYACRCGAARCRGTIVVRPRRRAVATTRKGRSR